jgi:hypothetical protein
VYSSWSGLKQTVIRKYCEVFSDGYFNLKGTAKRFN